MATEALKKPMLEGSGDIVKKKQQKRLVLAKSGHSKIWKKACSYSG
jgi:hypothetical protein